MEQFVAKMDLPAVAVAMSMMGMGGIHCGILLFVLLKGSRKSRQFIPAYIFKVNLHVTDGVNDMPVFILN
jgi:hypothetical protein